MSFKFISIIVTSFNDGDYLDRLFQDLAGQELSDISIEILYLEAGSYDKERALKKLGPVGFALRYFNIPGIGRTDALNRLIDTAQGDLIIRLDARTHIAPNYIRRIIDLSEKTGAENVGGVMLPIGESKDQKIIAAVMKNPIALGGAKFRNRSFTGEVDSVYLGAFNPGKINVDYWFDDNGRISEESDLNYRIRQSGGKVVVDSSIVVEYFPRSSIKSFLRLCFNYGVGRGLFMLKHKTFSALRQIVPPTFFLVMFFLLVTGFYNSVFFSIFFSIIFCYLSTLSVITYNKTNSFIAFFKFIGAVLGCHFFWTLGLVLSPCYREK